MKTLIALSASLLLVACSPFQVAGSMGTPSPTAIGGKNISVTLGYDGAVRDAKDVAIVVEQSDFKIVQINGLSSTGGGGAGSYRMLWNKRLSTNAVIYTHLLPGTYDLTLRYVGSNRSSNYVGTATQKVTVRAGDTIAFIASEVKSDGPLSSRGTFSVTSVDRTADRAAAEADFKSVQGN